ncbi:Predicted kinase, aminoglycoside phosphotransferase (APT) family [Ornithinibacillus halophilus]|uniref:Predicted kinase, aminoglycoside phosphotransferase (APT) family n=2 Tax=Ornithinibacillus halophilus TaxID=930117 RepID=A0A1M5KWW9_9BACI|nr:Predicted kinase, aminoglycoside phosphotransferase (APT) family [Ornithinibacillus halophilus]
MGQISKKMANWIQKIIGEKSNIVSVEQMKGSTSSILYHIHVEGYRYKELVVRQHNNWEWLKEEPDLVLHEVGSLELASKVRIQSPEVLAYDPTGEECGSPAILMTKVVGDVKLKPKNMSKWLDSMAETLVKIHSIDAKDFSWKYFSYNQVNQIEVPSWSSISKHYWEKALEIAQSPRPVEQYTFIHRDYHPTNILWEDGEVCSVVDWVNACYGPKGVDIGHCRINLAMLYNVEVADEFLEAYISHAGEDFQYNPYWDIVSVSDFLVGPPEVYPGWKAFGFTGLTNEMIKERIDKYVMSLVNK